MPTEFGAELFAGRRPERDAIIVHRLRAAGAIVIGKTVTSQYALFVAGPTSNPHDLTHTPGGSSSGSAAAVAAGARARRARHTDQWLDHPAGLLLRNRRLQAEPRRAAAHRGVAAGDAHRPSRRHGAQRRRRCAYRRRDRRRGSATIPCRAICRPRCSTPRLATRPTPRLALRFGPFESRAEPATREAFAAFIARLPCGSTRSNSARNSPSLKPRCAILCARASQNRSAPISTPRATEVPELVVQLVRARPRSVRRRCHRRLDPSRPFAREPYRAPLGLRRRPDLRRVRPGAARVGRHRRSDLRHLVDADRRARLQPAALDAAPEACRSACRPSQRRAATRTDLRRRLAHAGGAPVKRGIQMRILIVNPNTTEAVTSLMLDAGRASASPGVEVARHHRAKGVALYHEPRGGADRRSDRS